MATRQKTIQFHSDTLTGTVADATLTALPQFTIYIPETVIAFRSVTVDIGFMDNITATGGTITEHRVALSLGGAGYTTFTELDDIANSGENIAGVIGPINFTSHFTTNWSGTSRTCDISVYFDWSSGTTLSATNVTAVVTITYDYDDDPATNPTQTKTVRIPMESLVGTLSTTANSNIGSNQIPALTGGSGILPENSVVIRDYAILMEGNTANNNATTDHTVSFNIDSGTAFPFASCEGALGSDRHVRLIWRPTPPDTTAAHQFQAWSSVTNRMNHTPITLVVTYEFDVAATTRVLNSIIVPMELASPIGVTTSADASRFERNILVQEPGTITLRQSGFRIGWNVGAAISGLAFRAGAQTFRTITHSANVSCGMYSYQQRIDAGSAQGVGVTLARGKNTLTIDVFATDTVDQATNVSGFVIINYESDKSSGGIGQHAHTVFQHMQVWDALLTDRVRINNFAPTIPESSYWLVATGFLMHQWTSTQGMAVTLDVECLSGEAKGGGYYDIYADAYQADAERSYTAVWMRGRDVFKRFPTDPDPDRLDVFTARDYRLFTTTTSATGILNVLTYHSFSYTTTLNINGSNGGTVNIDVFRLDNDDKVATGSRTGDGPFDVTWYDNTVQVYAVAYEDDTHLGRSALFTFGD